MEERTTTQVILPKYGETQGTHHKMEKQLNFGESRMRGQGSVLQVHVWGQVCTEMCTGKPVYSAYRGLGHKVHGFCLFLAYACAAALTRHYNTPGDWT